MVIQKLAVLGFRIRHLKVITLDLVVVVKELVLSCRDKATILIYARPKAW